MKIIATILVILGIIVMLLGIPISDWYIVVGATIGSLGRLLLLGAQA